MINLTKRQKDIVLFLSDRDTPIRTDTLSQKFMISERSMRNDLLQIEAFLHEHEAVLERKTGVGLRLKCEEYAHKELRDMLDMADGRTFSKEERKLIQQIVLLCKEVTTFQELADICCVSRQTIINGCLELEQAVSKEQLSIQRVSGTGLLLNGEELHIRRLFIQLLPKIETGEFMMQLAKEHMNYADNALVVDRWIQKVEEVLHISFVNTQRLELMFAYLLHRMQQQHSLTQFPAIEESDTNEMQLLCDLLTQELTSSYEIHYLATMILSERMNQQVLHEDRQQNDEAHDIAMSLIDALKQLHSVDASAMPEMIQGLTLHLRSALYRSRNHIHIQNELLEQIKVSISLIYEFTRKQLYKIEQQFHVAFDEHEVAYIAMYIASIYETSVHQSNTLHILLICSFGLASSSILKTRITQAIPDCKIHGPLAMDEANRYLQEHEVDLVISTNVYSHASIPVIIVNPLLNQRDMENIKNQLYQFSYAKMCAGFMQSYADSAKREEKQQHYLKEYVRSEDMQILEDCESWETAIQLAATPLLKRHCVEQRYINSMIQAVHDYGTYMVLTPQTAYVHAGVNDGIYQNCTAVLFLKKPLLFGSVNPKKIRVIVVLGIRDKEDNDLLNLAYIFENTHNIEKLSKQDISLHDLEWLHD